MKKKLEKIRILLFSCSIILLFSCSVASAQTTDSTAVIQDEITLSDNKNNVIIDTNKNKTKIHSPKKAAWMSAALPGLGQIYNKKFWYIKVPVIYGGFAGLGYGIYYHYDNYAKYRDEYRNRLNGKKELCNPEWKDFPDGNINAMKQNYQRNMETFIIVTAVWYFINILDAVVYAHLLYFDVSDDLSLNIMPSMGLSNPLASNRLVPTTNITFTFKLK